MQIRAAMLVAVLLGGCTVGPDYHGPPAVLAQAGSGFHRGAEVQRADGVPVAKWWLALHVDELNRLEAAALAHSPSIAESAARLRQSRAGLREQRADLMPSTGTDALYLHLHSGTSLLGAGDETDLYNTAFDATWEVDLFGGQRRAIQNAAATASARAADFAGAQVSLTAEVAQAYVTLRDVQARMAISRNSADLQGRILELTRLRLAGGTASVLDVARLNTQVEQTRAALIPLQQQIEQQLDRLCVLTGQLPGALDAELGPPAALPLPPREVAIGDPAALLRRRPDIVAAERDIAAQNAVVGERVADLFPKLTLFGTVGFASGDIGTLFTSGGLTALGAPQLQWQPFEFGRNEARITAAKSGRDAAIAAYRGTVLDALQDAEDGLSRYGLQRQDVQSLARVRDSAEQAAALTRERYDGGTATLIDTLDTERQRLEAEQALAQATAELTLDYIALQKSLGLGWGTS